MSELFAEQGQLTTNGKAVAAVFALIFGLLFTCFARDIVETQRRRAGRLRFLYILPVAFDVFLFRVVGLAFVLVSIVSILVVLRG